MTQESTAHYKVCIQQCTNRPLNPLAGKTIAIAILYFYTRLINKTTNT